MRERERDLQVVGLFVVVNCLERREEAEKAEGDLEGGKRRRENQVSELLRLRDVQGNAFGLR